ncbi:MAG: Gfo/Idh/MocA family oxidoreductase [Betaproteobacteria bacterium]
MSRNVRAHRWGVAGLGRAFSLMLPTFVADDRVLLVAAADPRAEARARFASEFGADVYDSVEAMCASPAIDVVYVATPHELHAEHAALAASNGKHVLVEKPMALSVDDCTRMIDAARRAGVALVVGHSHSFDAPIGRARALIESGRFGDVRMIQALYYTDFLYRPRRAEELDTARGGGVVWNQAAHQVDIVRLLGGGRVSTVRALTGRWDRRRDTEGAYAALLTFADGPFAALTYNGYGFFDADELCGWVGELGAPKRPDAHGSARRTLGSATDAVDELAFKNARNYGGIAHRASSPAEQAHQHFGMVVVSCQEADLRPLPTGVMIYDAGGSRLEPVPVSAVPRREVIDELETAIERGEPARHDGAWARATLEVCGAMLTSAAEHRDVTLVHQVPVRVGASR